MSEITEKDFGEYLKEKIKKEISSWDAPDIYGVFISIYHNNRAQDLLELPFILEMGYYNSSKYKWDTALAFCSMDIIETAEERDALIKWLTDMGVKNIGIEDPDTMYDKKMLYIGKGPAGLYETLQFLVGVVKELMEEKFISEKFGRDIPVIFDDLEHTWYLLEATEKANPEGLAQEFLSMLEREMSRFLDGSAMSELCREMPDFFGDINEMMSDQNSPFYQKMKEIAEQTKNDPLYQKFKEFAENTNTDPGMEDIKSSRYVEQVEAAVKDFLKQSMNDTDKKDGNE